MRDLTHAGDAAIETEEGIVLARGALPGERVRLRIAGKRRGTLRGEVLETLHASPDRIAPACPLAERCGGCPLMALAVPAQRAWKVAHLQRLLARAGSAGVAPELIAWGDVHYRTRARLGFGQARGRTVVGYRAAQSDQLIDVERCPVLAQQLERGLAAVREGLAAELRGQGDVVLARGAGGLCVAAVISASAQPEPAYRAARALVDAGELAGIALRIGEARRPSVSELGDCRQHAVGHDGQPLLAPVQAFAQANAEVNAQLVARVLALTEPAGKRVLELYAGHGNLTVALAPEARALTALELDRDAAAALRHNLQARGLTQVKVVEADAAAAPSGDFDVLVLDPPREGAREALEALRGRLPERIVYVSCDPATLARDLTALAQDGYRADAASVVDMFPQTAHLESVVRLSRVQPSAG